MKRLSSRDWGEFITPRVRVRMENSCLCSCFPTRFVYCICLCVCAKGERGGGGGSSTYRNQLCCGLDSDCRETLVGSGVVLSCGHPLHPHQHTHTHTVDILCSLVLCNGMKGRKRETNERRKEKRNRLPPWATVFHKKKKTTTDRPRSSPSLLSFHKVLGLSFLSLSL